MAKRKIGRIIVGVVIVIFLFLMSLVIIGVIIEKNKFELKERTLSVNVDSLQYNTDDFSIFKSSVFFNPRTAFGRSTYFDEFDGHFATRIIDFEVNLLPSECFSDCTNSFVFGLENFNLIKDIGGVNDRIIVLIHSMPLWLSSSQDQSSIGEERLKYMSHSPRDYELWGEVVREAVRFFSQHSSNIYFEIGNEPDLELFWQEDTDAFLKFYEETAKNIRIANPNG